ncbi:hypothetical protein MTO96_049266 [Rhipicephalus appendiculatus]
MSTLTCGTALCEEACAVFWRALARLSIIVIAFCKSTSLEGTLLPEDATTFAACAGATCGGVALFASRGDGAPGVAHAVAVGLVASNAVAATSWSSRVKRPKFTLSECPTNSPALALGSTLCDATSDNMIKSSNSDEHVVLR